MCSTASMPDDLRLLLARSEIMRKTYSEARTPEEDGMNLLAGEVWLYVGGQRYTLHLKDFATATEFCRAFRKVVG